MWQATKNSPGLHTSCTNTRNSADRTDRCVNPSPSFGIGPLSLIHALNRAGAATPRKNEAQFAVAPE